MRRTRSVARRRRVACGCGIAEAGITPLRLRPKEALAIMNGTAVMTALACLNYVRAEYLTRLATRITRAGVLRAGRQRGAFRRRRCSRSNPIPASNRWPAGCAKIYRFKRSAAQRQRLQDRYSIRCAPHVIGVLADALPWLRSYIENELNSANDNPIIDAEANGCCTAAISTAATSPSRWTA